MSEKVSLGTDKAGLLEGMGSETSGEGKGPKSDSLSGNQIKAVKELLAEKKGFLGGGMKVCSYSALSFCDEESSNWMEEKPTFGGMMR